MPKVMIEVPEGINEEKIKFWIAEGMSRELFKKIVLDTLKSGIKLNFEKAIREFEETRKDAWKEFYRILKPGGLLVVLEFTKDSNNNYLARLHSILHYSWIYLLNSCLCMVRACNNSSFSSAHSCCIKTHLLKL